MLSLDNSVRYWLYSRPVSMRKGFSGLSGIVMSEMGRELREGDVFVFVNARRNQVKMIRREGNALVLYNVRTEMGCMSVPSEGAELSPLDHDGLVRMIRSALDSPYVRRMRLAAEKLNFR